MRDKKPELLVPAGGLDTLKVAVDYGADAVYIGGQAFGLRAKADNFSIEEMKQGVEYAHAHTVVTRKNTGSSENIVMPIESV